ncbi:MAG: type II secretion system F family protein, partial [Terriglobia bacterium]
TFLALAIIQILFPRDTPVEQQLSVYDRRQRPVEDKRKTPHRVVAIQGVLKRVTGLFLRRRGVAEDLQDRLDQANIPVRASEFVFAHFSGVILAGVIGLFWTRSWVAATMLVLIGTIAPLALLDLLKKRRVARFHGQLPETLGLISGALKAGYSFLQALDMAAQETQPPISVELAKVITETQLGLVLEDSLDNLSARIKSPDLDWTIMAVKIQKEVGGNLAEVLEILAETLRERSRISGQIKALTAEGRLSAIILFLLPFVIGGIIFFLNPGYLKTLTDTLPGRIMIVSALSSMGIGGFWLKKVTTIEV